MTETLRYTLQEPARLIYSSITERSAPKGVSNAEPKFSGTFGIGETDYKAILELMVKAIKSEMGSFTGKGDDYYLACMSSATAAKRALAKAELDAAGKPSDEAFKIKEKAEKRAELYKPYAGILTANSKFDVAMAKLEGGTIKDISQPHEIAIAGKENFYPGAWVVPAVAFKAFRRKKLDDKDGVTAFLQNVLFIRKGERLGGLAPDNKAVFGGYANYSDVDPTAMAPDGAPAEEDEFAGF